MGKIENLDIWIEYTKTKDKKQKKKIKDKIVEIYYPLVEQISFKMAEKINWKYTPEELASFGIDGLYQSISKYNLDRNINFKNYASQRISGSMLDGIRRESFIPRSVLINNKKMNKIKDNLQKNNNDTNTEEIIANELGVSLNEFIKKSKKYHPVSIISLDGLNNNNENNDFNQDCIIDISDKKNTFPIDKLLKKEFLEKLLSKGFTKIEQKIIYDYYYKNCTMEDIAKKLNLSESRISQKHADILERLKDKIKRNPNFFSKKL